MAKHAQHAGFARQYRSPVIRTSESARLLHKTDVAEVSTYVIFEPPADALANVFSSQEVMVKEAVKRSFSRWKSERKMRTVPKPASKPAIKRMANAKLLADLNQSAGDRAVRIGASPFEPLSIGDAIEVVRCLKISARSLAGTRDALVSLFDHPNFDGTGMSATELVKAGRTTRVIMRLDELRVGPQG